MKPALSLVIPVYNEEAHIATSITTVRRILDAANISHQFILVDDGSRDGTWAALQSLAITMTGIRAYKLSRNFGKEAALCAGLEQVDTDLALVMDSDLQHPPELIPAMVAKMQEGYDVVEGIKSDRGHEGQMYKLGARAFYSSFMRLTGFDLRDASDFKLMNRRVINAWRQLPERDTFFRGMAAWVGFKRYAMPFQVARRVEGVSKWSPVKLSRLFISAISSFSSLPLQIITILGAIFFFSSLLLAIWTLYMKFAGTALSGFTTVILLQLIIGSAIMFGLGTIGLYLARIYDEIKARPRYLIEQSAASTVSTPGTASPIF
ncbi:MAG: glycosyltransferase family 2 protein [Brachymonas sp.]|jgi:glycosyltransferase involved in cell wall biosynthesis